MRLVTYQTDKTLNDLRSQHDAEIIICDELGDKNRSIAHRLADHMSIRLEGSGTTNIELILVELNKAGKDWKVSLFKVCDLQDRISQRLEGLRSGLIACVAP